MVMRPHGDIAFDVDVGQVRHAEIARSIGFHDDKARVVHVATDAVELLAHVWNGVELDGM
ncbi:hypothetical protein AeNC1_019488, partial [Aphanomyces euteiches]